MHTVHKEHYLRDDIWCGSQLCTECKFAPSDSRKLTAVGQENTTSALEIPPKLLQIRSEDHGEQPSSAASSSSSSSSSSELKEHKESSNATLTYLIVDTNVVLQQLDLLEKPVFHNIIFLQTGTNAPLCVSFVFNRFNQINLSNLI